MTYYEQLSICKLRNQCHLSCAVYYIQERSSLNCPCIESWKNVYSYANSVIVEAVQDGHLTDW